MRGIPEGERHIPAVALRNPAEAVLRTRREAHNPAEAVRDIPEGERRIRVGEGRVAVRSPVEGLLGIPEGERWRDIRGERWRDTRGERPDIPEEADRRDIRGVE